MMRWLDPLGWLKWPSLLLIAAPLAAYPTWSPDPQPGADCGLAVVDGQAFRVFKAADGSAFILRPTTGDARGAPVLATGEPAGVDAGGMLVDAEDPAFAGRTCSPAPAP